MTRRLTIPWPTPGTVGTARGDDRAAFVDHVTPLRILAVSDDVDPALHHAANRERLGRIDLICGCGDLPADYLCFLGDAFVAPLVYVRGNHDVGTAWERWRGSLPEPLADGMVRSDAGIRVAGFSWPSWEDRRPQHSQAAAWRQVLPTALRTLGNAGEDLVMLSHVPPRGSGDVPSDPFHIGYAAYRWLAGRLRPRLWLHGHTPMAACPSWHCQLGDTEVVNVTGSVLIELSPRPVRTPDVAGAEPARAARR
ncbi:metallophosphoesterase [soil metagenome]